MVHKLHRKHTKEALAKDLKHFLVGDLSYPQMHEYIPSKKIEISLANLKPGKDDNAHWHPKQDEYVYFLSGKMRFTRIPSGHYTFFQKGDFMHVPIGMCHFEKVLQPTSILVIKAPGEKNKITCIKCRRKCAWRKMFEARMKDKKEIV